MNSEEITKKYAAGLTGALTFNQENQPVLTVTGPQQFELIKRACRKLKLEEKYKADLIIVIGTGGLFGVLMAKAMEIPYGLWQAESYEDNPNGIGTPKKRVRFSQQISLPAGFVQRGKKGGKKKLRCGRVLLVDDLDDSGRTLHKAKALLKKWFEPTFELRTLTLWHKTSSAFFVDVAAEVVEKEPETGEYPWIEFAYDEWVKLLKAYLLGLS